MKIKNESKRDIKNLFIHKETLKCICMGCIPCSYKLIINGKDLIPNQRPEMCLRLRRLNNMKKDIVQNINSSFIGIYQIENELPINILTLGDGDFSFSMSLAKGLRLQENKNINLIATSYESRITIEKIYPNSKNIVNKLNNIYNVCVRHEIDATNANHLNKFGCTFDKIIWNFPCIRKDNGTDGQNQEMEINKKLIQDFFYSVKNHTSFGKNKNFEIHLTHKTKAPFSQWGIIDLAKKEGFILDKTIVFDRVLYPGYMNKKALLNGSFPIFDSQTFIFRLNNTLSDMSTKSANDNGEYENNLFWNWTMDQWNQSKILIPVTIDLLNIVLDKLSVHKSITKINNRNSNLLDLANKKRKRIKKKKFKRSKKQKNINDFD